MFNITKFESGTIFIQDNSAHASRIQVYEGELPAFIQKLSQYLPQEPRTTNLNFWEAYQAMKRGEWVSNDELYGDGQHVEPNEEGEFVVYGKSRDDWSLTDFDIPHLDSTAWYIVPKVPRYKIGDRFERKSPTNDKMETSEIMYAEITPNGYGQYATRIWDGTGEHKHFRAILICGDSYFANATKLPD